MAQGGFYHCNILRRCRCIDVRSGDVCGYGRVFVAYRITAEGETCTYVQL